MFQNTSINISIYLSTLFTWKSNYWKYLYVGKLNRVKRLNYVFIYIRIGYRAGDASPDPAPNLHGFLKHLPSPPYYNSGSSKTRFIRGGTEWVFTGQMQIVILTHKTRLWSQQVVRVFKQLLRDNCSLPTKLHFSTISFLCLLFSIQSKECNNTWNVVKDLSELPILV